MAVSHIEVVQVPAQNLDVAVKFYSEALGLKVGARGIGSKEYGGSALFDFEKGPALEVVQPPSPYGEAGKPVIAMQVKPGSDVPRLLRAIEAAGGTITARDVRTSEWLIVRLSDSSADALELLIPY